MAKKTIKGEDGKEYTVKVKKPFYKRIWFWIITVIIIVAIGGNMGKSGSNDSSSSSSSSTSKNSSSSSSSQKSINGLTKANFDKITVSDSTGTSESDVQSMFGKKPDSTDEQTVQNVTAKMYTWSGVENSDLTSTIVVSFENGHAISKAITGLKVNRSSKITLDQFNNLQNGTSKADVQKQFGKPNGYDYSNVGGQSDEMWEYTSDVNGSLGANFNVTFTNGVVSGKTQTSMK